YAGNSPAQSKDPLGLKPSAQGTNPQMPATPGGGDGALDWCQEASGSPCHQLPLWPDDLWPLEFIPTAGGAFHPLHARALELHSLLIATDNSIAFDRRTTAVLRATGPGGIEVTIVASSEGTLAPIQRNALREGEEVEATGRG